MRINAKLQDEFRRAAAEEHALRRRELDRSGADTIELSTSDDWLGAIIAHVQNRRLQAVRGATLDRR